MLSAGWLVLAVILAILITAWVFSTLTRLDRLHARVDAAQAALDAQLVRRAVALQHVSGAQVLPAELADRSWAAAELALARSGAGPDRQVAENQVGRAITELAGYRHRLPSAAAEELAEGATRVLIARRFYNDAVRDTRTLRARRMPRLLHLAGRRELPLYFDIDDSSSFAASAGPDSASTDNR
ncbi:MAG TPA: NUDIX hydrolase [Jatrophihabitans sp.]|nr:NUDIX hydrolase [Jatrophihabitans sp.]